MARQMRGTAVWLMPARRAIERVLQCVAFAGISSRVSATRRPTASSPIRRGAPERGASTSPSKPVRGEAPAPGRHRRPADTECCGDTAVGGARLGAGQDDPDALRQSLTPAAPAKQKRQLGPLAFGQVYRRSFRPPGHGRLLI